MDDKNRFAKQEIRLFRVERMHDQKYKRIILALRDQDIADILMDYFGTLPDALATGEFSGPLPAGFLANEGQKTIGDRRFEES